MPLGLNTNRRWRIMTNTYKELDKRILGDVYASTETTQVMVVRLRSLALATEIRNFGSTRILGRRIALKYNP